jgi:hypothetical protein
LNSKEEEEFLRRYAFLVGSLVINFQSLELLLRGFLQDQPGAEPLGLPPGQDFYSSPEGSVVALCPLTNHDSLDKLIEKYNRIAHAQGKPKVDPKLVEVRDALAHGRNSATTEGVPMRSIKFSAPLHPDKKTVRVSFNAVLDEKWFKEQKARVVAALFTVHQAAGRAGEAQG